MQRANDPSATTYDTAGLVAQDKAWRSFAHGVSVIVGVVAGGLLLLFVLLELGPPRPSLAASLLILGVFGTPTVWFAFLAWWGGVIRGGRGAHSITLSRAGVMFSWPNGRSTFLAWDARWFRVEIQWEGNTISRVTPRLHPSTRVPVECSTLLRKLATERGLRVIDTKWSSRFGASGPLWVLKSTPRSRGRA